jgi:hypothetical protein
VDNCFIRRAVVCVVMAGRLDYSASLYAIQRVDISIHYTGALVFSLYFSSPYLYIDTFGRAQ